jgi:nitrogen-specific signal transduction histidine kinase
MNLKPICILYTQDDGLVQRIGAYLGAVAKVRHVAAATDIEGLLSQYDPALLLIDLRADACRLLLGRTMQAWPESLVLALGMARSNPALEAEAMGVYAVEDLSVDRQRLQSLVKHAHAHLALVEENRMLRREVNTVHPAPLPPPPSTAPMHLQHFARAFQQFENVDALLDNMIHGIATCARVARVGIFAYDRPTESYRFVAGMKCLPDVKQHVMNRQDPFVNWLHMNAYMACRQKLAMIENPRERTLLSRSLDAFGAEVIVPLHGREQVMGWLFVGRQLTGEPFKQNDLEDLMLLSEHLAIALENSLLYEKVTAQKALADTVFDAMPIGIVAVGVDSEVRWLNAAAEAILNVDCGTAARQPARRLSSRLGDALLRRIKEDPLNEPFEWVEPSTQRSLSVLTRRLFDESRCLGAIAIVRDLTREHVMREKQDELERTAFWAEMAAAMSHEVRNPLVAISTFAQLLPERYGDAEFRDQFSGLVANEIRRLDGMIDQITAFADAPALHISDIDIAPLVRSAVAKALAEPVFAENKPLVEVSLDDTLPTLRGDADALVDCIRHLVLNSIEAVAAVQYPAIHVTASVVDSASGTRKVRISVVDNGAGIANDMREKVFSPFCTTKARGIGLGLPIARRTVVDHGGTLVLDSSAKGTSIEVLFPVPSPVEPEFADVDVGVGAHAN